MTVCSAFAFATPVAHLLPDLVNFSQSSWGRRSEKEKNKSYCYIFCKSWIANLSSPLLKEVVIDPLTMRNIWEFKSLFVWESDSLLGWGNSMITNGKETAGNMKANTFLSLLSYFWSCKIQTTNHINLLNSSSPDYKQNRQENWLISL